MRSYPGGHTYVREKSRKKMNENSYLGKFFEGFIFLFIILVIMQTFGEEFAVFRGYSVQVRKYLLIAGFAFDFIFSVEFISRLSVSGKKKKTGTYFAREGGIIDLLSSLPLLLLNSGPLLYMTFLAGGNVLFFSIGGLSFLKIVKLIRAIRILRFFRALKILGKTRTRYVITPRYINTVIIIVICICVGGFAGFYFLDNNSVIRPGAAVAEDILEHAPDILENPEHFLGSTESVLLIKKEGAVLYRGIDSTTYAHYFMGDDSFTRTINGYDIVFNNKDTKRAHALIHMTILGIIIGVILGITTIYNHFFNRHIASVVTVMLRGFATASYSTPVRIRRGKEHFETYLLAEQYNNKWLPIKRRLIELKKQKAREDGF